MQPRKSEYRIDSVEYISPKHPNLEKNRLSFWNLDIYISNVQKLLLEISLNVIINSKH